MEENPHLAVVTAHVAEGVLDFSLGAGGGTCEVVVAHRDRDSALELDLVVVVAALSPALATIDRKAGILLVAVLDNAATNEVRHRLRTRRAELVIGGLRRFEKHVRMTVGIELGSGIASGRNVIALLLVSLGDTFDCTSPSRLDFQDLLLCHWDRPRRCGRSSIRSCRTDVWSNPCVVAPMHEHRQTNPYIFELVLARAIFPEPIYIVCSPVLIVIGKAIDISGNNIILLQLEYRLHCVRGFGRAQFAAAPTR
mmetsp:Transcript_53879/g.89456  ORF Transcript_53879/g.89456 Transcript_53879/m.89456 type:complete len:253 (+) Transcript_53879:169-927(+)